MATINWGIIGCGDVTEKKSGPAMYKVANSSLIAVMRRNAEKAADYARRHSVSKWYDDAEKLLNDSDLNSIYIATPPGSHLDYALAALQRGLNVYVEKPVTLNAAQARQIADAVKQYNGKLSIAHYRRALPMFLHVKQLLDNNTIGEIRTVQIKLWQSIQPALITYLEDHWRVQPEQSGGGYFHDMSPHQLDLMLFYFGAPRYYSGASLNQAGKYNVADHVTGHIVFKNNVVFNGSWCFNVAESEIIDQCEIIGTKGSITFPVFGSHHEVKWRNEEGEYSQLFKHPEHISQPHVENVVNYFNGEGDNPCGIDEAIVLMDIIDAFAVKR